MRGRLVAAFVLVLGIVLVAQNLPLIDYLRGVEEDRQRTGLERDAFVIAGRAEELFEADRVTGDSELQRLIDDYRSSEGHRVVIVDGLGSAILISDETAASGADYSTRPEIGRALTGQIASGRRFSETLDLKLVYVAVPVLSGDSVVGAVRLTSPASEIDDLVDSRIRGIVLVVAIALALGVIVALVLAQGISRPLRALKHSTDLLAAGELTARADSDHGPSEVRELASAFNSMAFRLGSLVESQRSFAGDASHQLRTPLTALRLQVEQALTHVDSDIERTKTELERATEEIQRLLHLVEGLLMLARLEHSSAPRAEVNVTALIRDRADTWTPLVEERGGTLSLQVDENLVADLIPGTFDQVLDNLIDNSIDASLSAPDIGLSATLDESGRFIDVGVVDRGRGMTGEEIARAFDRFWRSTTNTKAGSGIGLSIVRRLVEVNDGDIRLESRPGGGLVARVQLPISRQ